MGKTRLAVGRSSFASTYTDGAWLVELASAQASDEVDLLVAERCLSVPTHVRQSILGGVGHRRMLIVVDNCEHVLDPVGSLAVELLQSCDQVAILATSREPLGVSGERIVAVPSLDIDTEAVELFVARAAASQVGFEVEDDRVIREICRRLDGIPLAIELAAAAARTHRPVDIAARLRDHVDVVTGGRRGPIERHATVRAAIDWSWSLLTGAEQLTFARLSVFAGRFDLDAALAVIGDDSPGVDAFDVLSALADKSMLFVDQRGLSPFRLLEPVRQYARQKLANQGDVSQIARRHAEHYAAVAARLAEQLETSDEMWAAIALGNARDNLRAAFAFASTQGDTDLCLRIVTALGSYSSSYVWAEPWSWANSVLAMPGVVDHPLRPWRCSSRAGVHGSSEIRSVRLRSPTRRSAWSRMGTKTGAKRRNTVRERSYSSSAPRRASSPRLPRSATHRTSAAAVRSGGRRRGSSFAISLTGPTSTPHSNCLRTPRRRTSPHTRLHCTWSGPCSRQPTGVPPSTTNVPPLTSRARLGQPLCTDSRSMRSPSPRPRTIPAKGCDATPTC